MNLNKILFNVQFSLVAQSCPTLCDPMNHSTPGLPVHHQLPEFTQTHVHRVSDAIQPSNPLLSHSPPAPNPSQHQSLSNGSTLRMRWPKYWSFSLMVRSFLFFSSSSIVDYSLIKSSVELFLVIFIQFHFLDNRSSVYLSNIQTHLISLHIF